MATKRLSKAALDAAMEPVNPDELLADDLPESAEVEALPKPPAKSINFDYADRFWVWLASVPASVWPRVLVYIYRLFPKINVQLRPDGTIDKDVPINIDKIGHCFTQEDMFTLYGSGEYMLVVKDIASRADHVCKVWVRLDDPERPPKGILPHQLDMGARQNQPYIRKLIAEGRLTPDGKVPETKAQEAPASDTGRALEILGKRLEEANAALLAELRGKGDEAAIGRAMDVITDAYKRANQAVAESRAGAAPTMDEIFKLAERMANLPRQVASAEGGANFYDKLLVMQAEHHKRELELLQQLMDAKLSKPDSPDVTARITELKALKDALSVLGGGEGGSTRSTLDIVLEHVAPVLDKALSTAQMVLAARQQQQPSTAGMTGQPSTNPAALPLPSTPESPMTEEVAKQQVRAAITQQAPLILNMLNIGKDGFDIANTVESLGGTVLYEQIISLGADGVLEALKASATWPSLAPIEVRVRQVIKEFIEWGQPEPEEPPAPTEAPTTTKRGSRK